MKRSKRNPFSKAISIIEGVQCPLYALEDICNAVQTNSVTPETAHDVAIAMREKIGSGFLQAAAALPKGHEAQGFLKSARERLAEVEALSEFSLGGGMPVGGNRALGRAMLSAVSAAGRFMELAEYSLGDWANCGWIGATMNMDGMDERYVRVIDGAPNIARLDLLDKLTPEEADSFFALVAARVKGR